MYRKFRGDNETFSPLALTGRFAAPYPEAEVSKLAGKQRRVLLPLGEGGAKRRMRAAFSPLAALTRRFAAPVPVLPCPCRPRQGVRDECGRSATSAGGGIRGMDNIARPCTEDRVEPAVARHRVTNLATLTQTGKISPSICNKPP